MKGEARQWIASLACTLCFAAAGTNFAWVAPILVSLVSTDSPVPMTAEEASWVSSIIGVGGALASIPGGILADRIGRKATLLYAGPLCLLAWILIIITRSVTVLYVVRIIQGLVIGGIYAVGPVYLAEISEPNIRGKLSSQCQTFKFTGALYAYITGAYLTYEYYAYACTLLPILFIAIFYFAPESPYYLLMKDREEDARKSLAWLQHSQNFDEEFESIKKAVNDDMKMKSNWKDLFATKKDVKAFLLVQLICIIKHSNGSQPILMYASQAISDDFAIGSNEMSIMFAASLLLTTLFASIITDKIGRRTLLIISTLGAAIFNFISTVMYYLDSETSVDVSDYKWIGYASLIGFAIVSNVGLGPLMQTVQAEYFPSHTRGIGGGVTETIASIALFINIRQYQILQDYFGTYMNFAFFCSVSLIGFVLITILIPETSGKSLAEVQECFDKKRNGKP